VQNQNIAKEDEWGSTLFLVIFDDDLRKKTLKNYIRLQDVVEGIHRDLRKIVDKIYLSEDASLPAKFASMIFMGEDFWDYSLETRVIPALFQIMIDILALPMWVSWYDLEIGEELIRLTVFFSEGTKVKGIPGRVIVAQISDDDREIEIVSDNERIKLTTLKGGITLLLTIKKDILGHSLNINELRRGLLVRVEETIKSISGKREEIEELTDLEAELKKLEG